ncbi:molybdopterin molybdotransferase MoeA [Chitinimonas naiadis]
MFSKDDVLRVLERHPLPAPQRERVGLQDAVGRASSDYVLASYDLPLFDASAMDGFAIAVDPDAPRGPYRLAGCVGVGDAVPRQLAAGEALRVVMGAMLPEGCRSVVPHEQVTLQGDHLWLNAPVPYGAHMRPRGSELSAGTVLLEHGTRIGVWHVGVLASQGIREVEVFRKLRVGVISSGNEIVDAGQRLGPGQVFDVNRPQILALLRTLDVEAIDMGCLPDDGVASLALLRAAAEACDMMISTGGLSADDSDHVRTAAQLLGTVSQWRVAIAPGRPFAFGHITGKPFLALPGNPVAAAVMFLTLVKPFVQRASGQCCPDAGAIWLPLARDLPERDRHRRYLSGRLVMHDGRHCVEALESLGAGTLFNLAEADLLFEVPEETRVGAKDHVRCHLLHRAP